MNVVLPAGTIVDMSSDPLYKALPLLGGASQLSLASFEGVFKMLTSKAQPLRVSRLVRKILNNLFGVSNWLH